VSSKATYARIEEHLQKAEQAIKQKKRKPSEEDGTFVDDEASDLESESSETVAKTKKSSGSKSKAKAAGSKKQRKGKDPSKEEDKRIAREEKALEKKKMAVLKKKAKEVTAFGTRALSAMAGPLGELRMALDTVQGSGAGKFSPVVIEQLKNHWDTLAEWKRAGTACVKAAAGPIVDGVEDLPFDHSMLQNALKLVKETLKVFNDMGKLVNL
jgi:outer membrane biosynthesis protein TonB